MRLSLIPSALAAFLAFGTAANAAVELAFSSGLPVVDTDGQPQPITGEPVVDVDFFNFATIGLDIRVFSVNEPSTYAFTVSRDDFFEIDSLASVSEAPTVTLLSESADALFYQYTPTASAAIGDILASFQVTTKALGGSPDDELPDIIVSDTLCSLGIWNPATGAMVVNLNVDFQQIPLPAGVFLLAGALGALGLMRRRSMV